MKNQEEIKPETDALENVTITGTLKSKPITIKFGNSSYDMKVFVDGKLWGGVKTLNINLTAGFSSPLVTVEYIAF